MEKEKENERSRRWQLTENNPGYTKEEAVKRLTSIAESVYAIGCSETGESGTKHVHVFVVYKNAIRMGSLKKLFERAHFEACKGSNVSNRDYIVKSDKEPYEVGDLPLVTYKKPSDNASEVVALMGKGKSPLAILQEEADLCDYVVKHFHSLNEIYASMIRESKRH